VERGIPELQLMEPLDNHCNKHPLVISALQHAIMTCSINKESLEPKEL
jgi:hypothetical protein